MSKWIKCSAQMPDYFSDVLITDGKHVEVKWWDGDEWDCWAERNPSIRNDDVTHRVPLPQPPEV